MLSSSSKTAAKALSSPSSPSCLQPAASYSSQLSFDGSNDVQLTSSSVSRASGSTDHADLEALPRLIFGLAFILLALLDIGDSSAVYTGDVPKVTQLASSGWVLPLTVLMFAALAAIEYTIWLFSFYSIRRRVMIETAIATTEKDSDEPQLTEEPTPMEVDERAPPRETLERIETRLERARTERNVNARARTRSRSRHQTLGDGPGFLPQLDDPTG